jgi:pimeloyl-ACP methyl ester carboxylesterase
VTAPPDPSVVRVPGPWAHREVSANGIRLHVVERGSGPLVVLLHGFPEFWWSWRHQLVALAEAGYRAVAVDLRGYGDSDKPPRGYDLWTLSGDVAGLIRALGERDAVVVGHDWGGIIAWTLSALHPRLVRALVVVDAPHPLAFRHAFFGRPRSQGWASRYMLGFQVPFRPERSLRADGGARVERIMRAWSAPEWPASAQFAEVAARNREAMLIPGVSHCSMEYYRWVVRSQFRPDGRHYAAAMDRPAAVPVLQLHGADDPCLLERTARDSWRWAGPEHSYEVIPGVGHFPHQELPDATTALLTKFIAH